VAWVIWDILSYFPNIEECVIVAPAHSTYDAGSEIMRKMKDSEKKAGGPGGMSVDSALLTFMTQAEFEGAQQLWGGDCKYQVRVAV
jgi:hypothetical protein